MKTISSNNRLRNFEKKQAVRSLNAIELKRLNGGRKALINTGGGGGVDE